MSIAIFEEVARKLGGHRCSEQPFVRKRISPWRCAIGYLCPPLKASVRPV